MNTCFGVKPMVKPDLLRKDPVLKEEDLRSRMPVYLLMAGVFFLVSLLTIFLLHRYFLESRTLLDSRLLTTDVIAGLAVLLLLYYLTDGARLYMVVRAMGHHVPFGYIIKLVFVNIFFSNVTPLSTGGGFVQIYLLSRKNIPIGEATAVTTIRTITAALGVLTLAPIIIVLEPQFFHPMRSGKAIAYFLPIGVLYLTYTYFIIFRVRTLKIILFHLLRFLHRKGLLSRRRFRVAFLRFSLELTYFHCGFRKFIRGPFRYVLGSMLFTSLFLLTLFSFSVVLIRGLGYDVPTLTILAIQSVVTFIMYFTPTPGAVGFAESGYVLLFSQVISKNDITLLTICWRFLTIYVGVLLGILIAYRELSSVRPRRSA